MKTREIEDKYGIDRKDFESFVKEQNLPYSGSLSMVIEDSKVYEYVASYKETRAQEEADAKAKVEAQAAEAERKKKAMAEMLISSGFSFDGYTIVRYSGYISGDDSTMVLPWRLFSETSGTETLETVLTSTRRVALSKLKEAAYNLGCNAVIGVDFDYLTLDPSGANFNYKDSNFASSRPYVFYVTANGNAVVIQKNEPGQK